MTQPVDPKRRSFWLKTLHEWHWISSAVCLVGILLFSITGITLNHASQIEAKAVVANQKAQLPPALMTEITAAADDARAALPVPLREWIAQNMDVRVGGRSAEWSDSDIYVSMPRAGGDAWLSIDRSSGEIEFERTDRGWISWLNDLHKGRNTGPAWSWFIDVFAIACVVFAITGFFLLQIHARQRPMTWPLVGLGFLVMLLIAILFVH
ncbi:MAG TPA: PepSY-associated TM helix domain-containing protein [Dokdonella sp.]|uniref:PepSY-associated TM helix domain-containing protein n=1 Tax=Dokdonella sp. TaxID=2291710 RepID=UPI002D80A389|nr:PepSY-associated TM helix domain-containing protein [Dokdonella sp.]HET9033084.1 PepSY-associated TM helix domain-containing protein [Dokdonella sp.]